jgi:hypothetical protein
MTAVRNIPGNGIFFATHEAVAGGSVFPSEFVLGCSSPGSLEWLTDLHLPC